MRLTLTPRLATTLACACCGQTVDPDRTADTGVTVALFGAVRWAVCPVCRQDVAAPWDRAYKARVTRVLRRR